MMMETGTSALSDKQLDQQIGIHTGGINMNTYITDVNPPGEGGHIVLSGNNLRTLLFLSGKCMPDKASKLFGLYVQILKNANLDSPQKAVQILQEMVSEIKNDVSSSGTSYVLKRIRARYSVKGFVDEQMDGVAEAKAMEFFLGLAREHWGTLLGRLERMRHAILGSAREGMILNLTGDKKVLSLISSDVREFLTKGVPLIPELDSGSLETSASASLQDFATTSHPWVMPAMDVMSKDAPVRDEMIVTPTKVSYVGKGGLLYDLGEQVTGSATVAAQYLKHGYLYENIRLRNGAYGAWTALASAEGTLVLLSYRDPELGKTLEVFDLAADDLLEDATSGVLAEKGSPAITTAIIGAIGSLDGSALPPDEVGWESLTQWLKGSTVEGRQKWRDEILKTQASDFTDFAQRLKGWKQPSIAVVGSQFAYDEYSATAGYPPLEIVANI
uniref:Peptidase M16C associated domain-containing protein n=1 Tax=Trieres chinensis TaxID=1514140 RepID=A0A7S1ZPQ7_TRICV|mmetsp:Transcript_30461/g.62087  ORF Transcript_30461/g.62087 Transcript_30461/m.62087 type:complete len:444 (+) Transcript_30461:1-1332(+)